MIAGNKKVANAVRIARSHKIAKKIANTISYCESKNKSHLEKRFDNSRDLFERIGKSQLTWWTMDVFKRMANKSRMVDHWCHKSLFYA